MSVNVFEEISERKTKEVKYIFTDTLFNATCFSKILKFQQGRKLEDWGYIEEYVKVKRTHSRWSHLRSGSYTETVEVLEKRTDPICTAITLGHSFIVKMILAAGEKVHRQIDGEDLLSKAIKLRNCEVIEALLDAGHNVQGYNATPPLFLASQEGTACVAELLIKRGAKVECGGKSQNSKNKVTPLYIAAQLGHHSVVQVLLNAGAKLGEDGNENELTPLLVAAMEGNARVVEILLQAGAKICLERNGCTAFTLARDYHHKGVLQVLLRHICKKSG
eukprot:CAMPEP_0117764770 /NCGR_PEP_ID=MMETSP0947-20121206/19630_1 /TAXON_ID=44440 /ORGANISM="Chattonella subsalsa, Strain CCMP2191" /LENGTH=275 /DNA_ID=CAMNT_0005587129 /DNA_START=44 /DNA_END=871 /DNA_ORIENTATION=+